VLLLLLLLLVVQAMREVMGKGQRQELFSFAAASVLEVRGGGGRRTGEVTKAWSWWKTCEPACTHLILILGRVHVAGSLQPAGAGLA
jgi:hypothetical protein